MRLHRAVLAAALLAPALAMPAAAQAPSAAELAMPAAAAPFRDAVDRLAAAAAAADTAAVARMISPNMAARAGRDAVARVVATQILPFFAGTKGIGGAATITNTSDQFGSEGFAFYLYAVRAAGGDPRPFVAYVVEEGGRPVIANVLVDRFVEGRHR